MNPIKSLIYLTLILLSLGLSGCVALETHVTIYQAEAWKTELLITVPSTTLTMLGGEANFEHQLNLPPEQKSSRDGIDLTWEKEPQSDGSLVYRISSTGTGFDKLNQVAFDNHANIFLDANRQITLRYNPNTELITYTLRVTGGKIIDSNADRVEGSTAIWKNPGGEINVILTEAFDYSNWWLVGGVLSGLCLCLGLPALIGGGFVMSRRRSTSPAPVVWV